MSLWQLAVSCLLFVGGVGMLDYATGYGVSFPIFYPAPIAIAAWYGNRRCGLGLALVSAITWLTVDVVGGHKYADLTIPVANAMVRFGFFVIVALFIAAQRQHYDRAMETARTDPLTGLRNMKGFTQDAEALWKVARRCGHTTIVAYLDLDNFKAVNDTHGHSAGDAVLAAIGSILQKSVRSTDLVGRVGGDEFAALLPETSGNDAAELFRRIHAGLQRQAQEQGWPITASIGVTVVRPPYPSLADALKNADGLMYRAKQAGKNRVQVEDRQEFGKQATTLPR